MQILVTGSSGLIGSALIARLQADGHSVTRLVRGAASSPGIASWDPVAGRLDAAVLNGVDAVVHLAGEGIGERRWTPKQKRAILESRIRGTELIASAIAGAEHRPSALVSASAIGYYGDRGDEELTEVSTRGDGFLAELCEQWEGATSVAQKAGVRVVTVRSGIVLSTAGGALARMVLPFRLGLGGRIGSGRQYMSWITLDDEIGAIVHALTHDEVRGPTNLTAPNPVTNLEFTQTLGRVLHRPTVVPTPLLPLKLRYGSELVESLLVEGQRVLPTRLLTTGYTFVHPDLETALQSVLG
jgi:uncharacterized protein (TIGR01777 family)